MAKRVTIEILDGTNGSRAEQTIPFGLDGVAYEIDLSTTKSNALREALAPISFSRSALGKSRSAAKTWATTRYAKRTLDLHGCVAGTCRAG